MHYAPVDIWGTKDHNDEDEFDGHETAKNASVESADSQGDVIEKEFFTDWLPFKKEAKIFTHRYLRRYSPEAPAEIEFELTRKDIDVETGSLVNLTSPMFVEDDGSDATLGFQILSKSENLVGRVAIKALETNYVKKYGFIAHTGYPDYTSGTALQKAHAYICDTATEKMSNGDPPTCVF